VGIVEIWGFGVDAGLNEFAEISRNEVPTSVHGHSNLQVTTPAQRRQLLYCNYITPSSQHVRMTFFLEID